MPTKTPSQTQTQVPKPAEPILCPYCNHPPFKSMQARLSHIHYKHANAGTAPVDASSNHLAALPPPSPNSSGEAEKAALLAEIEELRKQVPNKITDVRFTPNPEPEPEPKSKVPWVVPGAKPAKRATLMDLKGADAKTKNEIVKTLSAAQTLGRNSKIEYGESTPSIIEYKAGSWMDVYKEDLLVRTIPFIWQQDKETKQNWAICLEQQFYGRKMGFMQLSYPLLIVGFDKSRKYSDYYGRGFKIAVDEVSQLQVPLHEMDSDEKLKTRLEDNAFNSQNMALYRELIIHAKKKWNWTLIIILILVAIIIGVAVYYLHAHPQFLTNLAKSI